MIIKRLKCNFTMVNICRGVDLGTTKAPQDSEFLSFFIFGTEEVMLWIYPHNITSSVPKIKNSKSNQIHIRAIWPGVTSGDF